MTRPVRLDDEADGEIEAAVAWYEDQFRGLGLALLDEVESAKRRLAESPRLCPLIPGLGAMRVRRCQVERFPYSLVFIELSDHIRVLAFAHARRRPLYWRKRVKAKKERGR